MADSQQQQLQSPQNLRGLMLGEYSSRSKAGAANVGLKEVSMSNLKIAEIACISGCIDWQANRGGGGTVELKVFKRGGVDRFKYSPTSAAPRPGPPIIDSILRL